MYKHKKNQQFVYMDEIIWKRLIQHRALISEAISYSKA